MVDDPPDVTATPPEAPVRLSGTDHVTLEGSNEADTIAFYRDLLGMALVLRQPNLDRPDVTHLFFDAGDGRLVSFFVSDERDSRDGLEPDIGDVHHLAFSVEPSRFAETREALREAGYPVSEYDRGLFHSLYTHDHNGLTIEIATDAYGVPDERRAEVQATAQRRREADGAEYVAERHLVAALEALGIDAERTEVPDAPPGSGVD